MSYGLSGSNTVKLDWQEVAISNANTNFLNAHTQPANYLVATTQSGSVFNIYICIDQAVSLVIVRTNSTNGTVNKEVFPVEVANQPMWHHPEVSMGEQINFQLSGPATLLKFTVLEPYMYTQHSS